MHTRCKNLCFSASSFCTFVPDNVVEDGIDNSGQEGGNSKKEQERKVGRSLLLLTT